ncbi:RNA-binding protein [Rhodospira trueperi]|uniref:YlxR domain-containing protein n=1 Tax=Rhodospira trueperi TaxID=69960 RepID=A0A1G7D651_9PROT|nr:RNA-binding protein [Rhodospira trueperi]SDE46987.1 hypothetical protein SAMN05421720_10751 [Rhodospira trueperi]
MAPDGRQGAADDETGEDDMPPGTRRCIVTRDCRPKSDLLRFVLDPDGQVVPDVDRRLPGRGLWLSPSRDVVEMAAQKRLFARAARRAVTVPADLADRVEALLTRRCLDTLGLARRAGQVVAGFEKVRTRLREAGASRARMPAVLLSARDGAPDGREKVAALAVAILESGEGAASGCAGQSAPPVVVGFDAEELGRPLGRDRVVHATLDGGRLAETFVERCGHLAGFRPGPVILSVADELAGSRGARRNNGGSGDRGDPRVTTDGSV